MRIEEYGPEIHINRSYMNGLCKQVAQYEPQVLWCAALNKNIVRYGCFDTRGRYFGNLGLEVEFTDTRIKAGDYAHFNLRGVNPAHFNIPFTDDLKNNFTLTMKHHPAIYKRVALIKEQCKFKNIHIHEDIEIRWGEL